MEQLTSLDIDAQTATAPRTKTLSSDRQKMPPVRIRQGVFFLIVRFENSMQWKLPQNSTVVHIGPPAAHGAPAQRACLDEPEAPDHAYGDLAVRDPCLGTRTSPAGPLDSRIGRTASAGGAGILMSPTPSARKNTSHCLLHLANASSTRDPAERMLQASQFVDRELVGLGIKRPPRNNEIREAVGGSWCDPTHRREPSRASRRALPH